MNEIGIRASDHEAHHVAACRTVGWKLLGASRTSGWIAETRSIPNLSCDHGLTLIDCDSCVRERGLEAVTVAIAPFIAGCVGVDQDLALAA